MEPHTAGEQEAMVEQQKKRDWVNLLAPSLLVVMVSLLVEGAGAMIYIGALSTRVTVIEKRQDVFDADRVTTKDLKDRDETQMLWQQQLDIHLNRLDDKLDREIEADHSSARKHDMGFIVDTPRGGTFPGTTVSDTCRCSVAPTPVKSDAWLTAVSTQGANPQ